jgi:hypothetical protein
MTLTWKMGFEIELMAPQGSNRAALADHVARQHGGRVRRFFHPQSEPSQVPGQPVFENLTQGFEVHDGAGRPIASFVDDLTLQAGLDKSAVPKSGWYRIVADDGRLLRLVMRQCDPDAPLDRLLDSLATLFGTKAQAHDGMVRVADDRGASVAIGAPLPGERERPCEIVTAPLETNHEAVLTALLGAARKLGFILPHEGATHIHFDAGPLLSARAVAALVDILVLHGDALKRTVGTNPNCVRLGRWPDALPLLTRSDHFRAMPWPQARAALNQTGLTKYCDFNLLNIAVENTTKHTFELRILPASLDPRPILEAAALFEAILRLAGDPPAVVPKSLPVLMAMLPLDTAHFWTDRVRAL